MQEVQQNPTEQHEPQMHTLGRHETFLVLNVCTRYPNETRRKRETRRKQVCLNVKFFVGYRYYVITLQSEAFLLIGEENVKQI